MPESTEYCLRVIRLERLQWKHAFHRKIPDLYAEVKLGDAIQRSQTIKRKRNPVWNKRLVFYSSNDSAIFEIRIKHASILSSDPCVGILEIRLADLLGKCTNGEASFVLLSSLKPPSSTTGLIVLHLSSINPLKAADISIETATESIQQCGIMNPPDISDLNKSISDRLSSSEGLYRAIEELISRLDVFRKVVDDLSEAVENVFETDRKVIALVRSLGEAFSFVCEAQTLKDRAASLQQPIDRLIKQTIECCLFVRQYTDHGFVGRMFDIDKSDKLDKFERTLANLKQQIDSGLIIHTAFASARAAERGDKLYLRQQLDPSLSDCFDRPECLPGTRMEVRRKIIDWVFSKSKQNIFWLHGVAGSGKSTISTTIANHFRDMCRLGALICFERGKTEPTSVIRTLAYQLAVFDPAIRKGILSELDSNNDSAASGPPKQQFEKLILEPLLAAAGSTFGPIVVVLDALDECGTPEKRRTLLELLQRVAKELPGNFRFLITSRQEPDIDKMFSSNPENIIMMDLDYSSPDSCKDVLLYLRTEIFDIMKKTVDIPEDWPWDENMSLLAKAAGGLFIWASTAVKIVRNSDNPFNDLDCLVSDSRSLSNFGLNELYATVLRSSGIRWQNKTSKQRFAKVMALLLLSKAPLSSDTIDGILGFPHQETSLILLSRLRSLITYTPGGPVRLFHVSFSDYLMSSGPSGEPWFIDISEAKRLIVDRCFIVMENLLRFNISDLRTSFVYNDVNPAFDDHVKTCVPPHLEYACLYWAQHLQDVPYAPDLLVKLSDFAYHRLLFWFEVLSLVKAFGRIASHVLSNAAKWSELHSTEIAFFLRDASTLATVFALPVAQCTPHIYVSMIPLSEIDSVAAAHYAKRMSSVVRAQRKGSKRSTACLKVFETSERDIESVAFSSNGQHLASASDAGIVRTWDVSSGEEVSTLSCKPHRIESAAFWPDISRVVIGCRDRKLRIWDVRTGELIVGPLSGHTDRVLMVTLSNDGTRIASGSKDKSIIIWNSQNGKIMLGPLKLHISAVLSVAFSPDGAQLASGSSDGTVIIWDAWSGKLISRTRMDHCRRIHSVSFAPDGRHLAYGSDEGTIRILEVESGKVISSFVKHAGDATSVHYSACGTRIVSGGSRDKTVVVWDARSGEVVAGPLEGHTGHITSISFSPSGNTVASGCISGTVRIWDATAATNTSATLIRHVRSVKSIALSNDGSRIASASSDNSLIVWSTESGSVVAGPFLGHTNGVHCVLFSSDGSHLISGSSDRTIRIWNIDTREAIMNPLEGHTDAVYCIALSPDGKTIASGSWDKTIRVWRFATGELVAGPLRAHDKELSSLCFSPDSKQLVSGSDDATIRIWSTETWKSIREPLIKHKKDVCSICFSPDGKQMASGSWDTTVIIWDVESSSVVAGPFGGHKAGVYSVIFSHDGTHVVSSSKDNTIRIWNVKSRKCIYKLEGHTNGVRSLTFSLDGHRLFSGSEDRTIRVWNVAEALRPSEVKSSTERREWSEWVLGNDGWIRDTERRLLLWIPPDLRLTLWRPRNTAMFSCEFSTKLDFSGAALGDRWTECFNIQSQG
ncbi:WD40 repeat-like protein [Sanghuangporus baumii]|uniref:WD40 repeat-like protein n=1 Tax=Sanghuangporus baumii TaxID=108892 RepID=A0A9Q5HTQ1_SANBA|nr:WD40 repeat-like protein [Sanghuangporus baumii]